MQTDGPDGATFTRRDALGTLAAAGAVPFILSGAAHASPTSPLGWDHARGRYSLPTLAYGYDALEPAIDAETMKIHHSKHHAGYVKGLNNALEKLEEIRESGDTGLIKHWSRELAFHGAGHLAHSLFWSGMAPAGEGGGGKPSGALGKTIERDFGSFEKFREQFIAASSAVEGSGWDWLVFEPVSKTLMVTQAEKHQDMFLPGSIPLLGIDVWEHAYYLRYQNRRGDYVSAFFDVINWGEIASRFATATGKVEG